MTHATYYLRAGAGKQQPDASGAACRCTTSCAPQVMLLDDETAPYVVGECLVHLPREEVEERLQKSE